MDDDAPPGPLIEELQGRLGVDMALLRIIGSDQAEVQCLGSPETLPPGYGWAAANMQPESRARMSWQRPGWLAEITECVDDTLRGLGRRRIGPPVQMRHTYVTGMVRFATDLGPVWLKAVPPLFAHEGPVLRELNTVVDGGVPRVLAVASQWWLSAQFPPARGTPREDPLVALGRLQRSTVGRTGDLALAGAARRPLESLPERLAGVADNAELLSRSERDRVKSALAAVSASCEAARRWGVPDTIVHGDFSPFNTRWVGDRWLIYDWTDCFIGHPFIDLASPLSYGNGPTAAARAREYLAGWIDIVGPLDPQRILESAAVLGAAFQTCNYASIVDAIRHTQGDEGSFQEERALLVYWVDTLTSLRVEAPWGPRHVANPAQRRHATTASQAIGRI
jgi:hypothetical protein